MANGHHTALRLVSDLEPIANPGKPATFKPNGHKPSTSPIDGLEVAPGAADGAAVIALKSNGVPATAAEVELGAIVAAAVGALAGAAITYLQDGVIDPAVKPALGDALARVSMMMLDNEASNDAQFMAAARAAVHRHFVAHEAWRHRPEGADRTVDIFIDATLTIIGNTVKGEREFLAVRAN